MRLLPSRQARPCLLMHRAAAVAATGSTDAATIDAAPPLPPRLRKEPQESDVGEGNKYIDRAAFDADMQLWRQEKEAREATMKLRRRALERQREQQRDRSGRQRPAEDNERRVKQRREKQAAGSGTDAAAVRAARDQLRTARSRPIPRVTASSYTTLVRLTRSVIDGVRGTDRAAMFSAQDQLVDCWQTILQRPLPDSCHFYLELGIVGIGRRDGHDDAHSICGRGVTLEPDETQCLNESCPTKTVPFWDVEPLPSCCTAVILSDGMFSTHGLHRGAKYYFDFGTHADDEKEEAEADMWPGSRAFTLWEMRIGVFEDFFGTGASRYFHVRPYPLQDAPERAWYPSGDDGDAEYSEAHAEWQRNIASCCNNMQCENDGQLRYRIEGPTHGSFTIGIPLTYALWHLS